jgi:predicted nucleic acid-binding protein
VGVPADLDQSAVFEQPLSTQEAGGAVSSWLAQPFAGVLEPLSGTGDPGRPDAFGPTTGALVMDAALAAIAIEHGATLHTTDRDFARFPGLRWINPLDAR